MRLPDLGPHPRAAVAPHATPNPFRATTEVVFATRADGVVDVRIFDLAGRQLAVLASQWRPAGPMQLSWDGKGPNGKVAPAGVYLAKIRAVGRTGHVRLVRIP